MVPSTDGVGRGDFGGLADDIGDPDPNQGSSLDAGVRHPAQQHRGCPERLPLQKLAGDGSAGHFRESAGLLLSLPAFLYRLSFVAI